MHKEDFRVIKQKGFYKLINGDCLEVMKGIPDKSIDCIVCDHHMEQQRVNGM